MFAMGGLKVKIVSVISESSSDRRKRARNPFMG
jgi:hypothetical protein